MPERRALPVPQSMKPSAKDGRQGRNVHSAKPVPASSGASVSRKRREKRSAQRPEGGSSAKVVTDQSVKSALTSAGLSPCALNSRA